MGGRDCGSEERYIEDVFERLWRVYERATGDNEFMICPTQKKTSGQEKILDAE